MERKQKINWLMRYRACKGDMEKTLNEIKQWRRIAEGGVISFHGGGHGRKGRQSQMEKAVCEMLTLQETLPQKVERMVELRLEVGEAIEKIPEARMQLLLKYRYLHGMTFAALGKQIDYCEYYVSQLHGQALDLLVLEEVA